MEVTPLLVGDFVREVFTQQYSAGISSEKPALPFTFQCKERNLQIVSIYHEGHMFLNSITVSTLRPNNIIWVVNYLGHLEDELPKDDNFDLRSIWKMRKEALCNIAPEYPYGGRALFKNGFEYFRTTNGHGFINTGHENIYFWRKLVATVNYQGGFIDSALALNPEAYTSMRLPQPYPTQIEQ